MHAPVVFLRVAARGGLLAVALVAAVLASGCAGQGPLYPYEWQGVGQTSVRTYTVRLVYALYGSDVIGSYYVDGASSPTGKAEGGIEGDVIQLALTPSTSCTFRFVGEISETRITGTFMPDACPGGLAGSWDLLRVAARP